MALNMATAKIQTELTATMLLVHGGTCEPAPGGRANGAGSHEPPWTKSMRSQHGKQSIAKITPQTHKQTHTHTHTEGDYILSSGTLLYFIIVWQIITLFIAPFKNRVALKDKAVEATHKSFSKIKQ